MKKIFFILLVLLATPILCLADNEGQCGDNAYWTVSDDTMIISGTGEMYAGSMSGSWFMKDKRIRWDEHKDTIKHIVIEEGITDIGIGAFARFSNLQSIQLPDTLTRICSFAFYTATNLQEINIPSSVKYIENHVFYCSVCGTIISYQTLIPALQDMDVLYLPESIKDIDSEAFSECLCEAVIIPDGCESVGDNAFRNCTNLIYVKIPSSVISIGENAFAGCCTDIFIDTID